MACSVWRTAARRASCYMGSLAALAGFSTQALVQLLTGDGLQSTLTESTLQLGFPLVLFLVATRAHNDNQFNHVIVMLAMLHSAYRVSAVLDVAHEVYGSATTRADQASQTIAFSMELLVFPLMIKLFADPPLSVSIATLIVPNGLFAYCAPETLCQVYQNITIHIYTGMICGATIFLEYIVRCTFIDTLKIVRLQRAVDRLNMSERELEALLKHYRSLIGFDYYW